MVKSAEGGLAAISTRDLMQYLCTNLGHDDAASECTKVIACAHGIETADELKGFSKEQLSNFGLPVKLVAAISNFYSEHETDAAVKAMVSFYSYTVRPFLDGNVVVAAFRDVRTNYLKNNNIEEWAAIKMQRAWRRMRFRKSRILEEVQGRLLDADFSRKTPEEASRMRQLRAENTIRKFVRRWKDRQAKSKDTQTKKRYSKVLPNPKNPAAANKNFNVDIGIVEHCLSVSDEPLDCKVSDFLRQLGHNAGRSEEEIENLLICVVTCNWLEDLDDLNLVEPHHWVMWKVPVKLSWTVDQAVQERQENQASDFFRGLFCCTSRRKRRGSMIFEDSSGSRRFSME